MVRDTKRDKRCCLPAMGADAQSMYGGGRCMREVTCRQRGMGSVGGWVARTAILRGRGERKRLVCSGPCPVRSV